MKVSALIRQLKKLPQDADVLVYVPETAKADAILDGIESLCMNGGAVQLNMREEV